MKKVYLIPKIKTIQINANQLMSGSISGGGQGETGAHSESKQSMFDINIEDEDY